MVEWSYRLFDAFQILRKSRVFRACWVASVVCTKGFFYSNMLIPFVTVCPPSVRVQRHFYFLNFISFKTLPSDAQSQNSSVILIENDFTEGSLDSTPKNVLKWFRLIESDKGSRLLSLAKISNNFNQCRNHNKLFDFTRYFPLIGLYCIFSNDINVFNISRFLPCGVRMVNYSPPAEALGSWSCYNEKHSSAKSRKFSHVLFISQKIIIIWEIVLLK